MPRPINRDRLLMIPRDQAAVAAHALLHPVQGLTPEQQVAGAAVLFAAICARIGEDPQALYQLGNRILRDENFHVKGNVQMQVLRDYAGIVIKGDRNVSIG
jgi:hypothetical protein